jgi:hypothetical protein
MANKQQHEGVLRGLQVRFLPALPALARGSGSELLNDCERLRSFASAATTFHKNRKNRDKKTFPKSVATLARRARIMSRRKFFLTRDPVTAWLAL